MRCSFLPGETSFAPHFQRIQFEFAHLPSLPEHTLRQTQEKACRRVRRSRTPYARFQSPTPRARQASRRGTPRLKSLGRESSVVNDSRSQTSELSEPPSDDSESEYGSEPEEQARGDHTKIPKPPGEAGRKNSGGFNLEEQLGWSKMKQNKLRVSNCPRSYEIRLTAVKGLGQRAGCLSVGPKEALQWSEIRHPKNFD